MGPGSTIPAPRSSSTPAHNGTASGPGGVGGPGTPDGPGGPGAPGSARIPAPRSPAAPGDTAGPGDAAGADGAATPCSPPQAAQNPLGLRSGPAAELSAGYGYELDPAASVPTPRFPSDPGAPFPLEDAPVGPLDAPRTSRDRLAALRHKPIYLAVSATMISATAAVAAAAGPTVVTPPPPNPDRSPSLAVAALGLASPAQKPGTPDPAGPLVPQVGGGAAILAPGQAGTSGGGPVLGSAIAAQAAADAKAYAEALARQAAGRPAVAPRNAPPQAPKPVTKPAVKPAPKPAAAPAAPAGNSVGARALSLAKGKLGAPYVWGAAGRAPSTAPA